MPTREPLSRIVISLGRDVETTELERTFPEITFDVVAPSDVERRIVDADAALIGFGSVAAVLDNAKKLRWIQTAGAGVERIVEVEGFGERDIVLTNGSGVMATNMAEHVIGLMLAFARGIPALLEAQSAHSWKSGVGIENVFELGNQTVVLVGTGDIALATAARLKAFGMAVIGARRTATAEQSLPYVDRLVGFADLDTVLPEADHVIASVPHTGETIGMFDANRFARFKDGAYFYNLGRGTSVVQPDLVAALHSGKLGGAGLDVTTPEPLPEADPLWDAPNVIITGHTAGATPYFGSRVLALFSENIRRYQAGEDLINVVNLDRGY